MPALQHVYVTAHGGHTSGHWLGEKAQIGFRLAIADETALPAKGTSFTMDTHGDVDVDTGTTAGTNGTLTRTWTARLGPIASTENADAAWQIDLAEDVYTFLNAMKAHVYSGFSWTAVKIAPILAAGNYGAPAAVYTFTTAIAGTATNSLPPECAVALTLRAPVVGRRGRGRVYWPAGHTTTSMCATDGQVGSTFTTLALSSLATLITNLENAPGTENYTPLVVVTSAGSLTAVRPSQIRVGSHFDVQRRRQHQVAESYTTTNL